MAALLEYYFMKLHSELSLEKNKYSVISVCRAVSVGVHCTYTNEKICLNQNQKII